MANKTMQLMHEKQAKLLTRLLVQGERALDLMETSGSAEERAEALQVVRTCASAAVLSTVNQFLKNNDVTAQNEDTDDLTEAEIALRNKRRRFTLKDIEPVSSEDVQ